MELELCNGTLSALLCNVNASFYGYNIVYTLEFKNWGTFVCLRGWLPFWHLPCSRLFSLDPPEEAMSGQKCGPEHMTRSTPLFAVCVQVSQ